MKVDQNKLNEIVQYIHQHYYRKPPVFHRDLGVTTHFITLNNSVCKAPLPGSSSLLDENVAHLRERVEKNIKNTWQEALFKLIDDKKLDEVDVYKKAYLTKQTFSKIRSDKDYHPDKDTAIQLCFGLMLSLDETLFLLSKAGYTLSNSIKRDIVVRYFIEKKEYDIINLDLVLEELKYRQFLKY